MRPHRESNPGRRKFPLFRTLSDNQLHYEADARVEVIVRRQPTTALGIKAYLNSLFLDFSSMSLFCKTWKMVKAGLLALLILL